MDPELQKEIEETVKELGDEPKEDTPVAGDEKPEEATPEPEQSDPTPEPEAEKPKEPAKIEAWRLKVAEDNWKKREAALLKEIEDAKKPAPTPEEPAPSQDEIEQLAKEAGFDEAQTSVVRKIVAIASKQSALPPEMQQFMKDYPQFQKVKESYEAQQAEAEFGREFESVVRPLVEAEYPGISSELLKSIKAKVRERIESDPKLLTAPLNLLYKGDDSFRGLVPKKKSADGGRPSGGARADKVIDFEDVSDEDIKTFDDETMEKYAAYQIEKERNRNK